MWFRVASVVPEMFIWFRVASVVFEMLHMVSCGQRGNEMLHVVSCGQCETRDISCGFVWPMWRSICFMWFRVASVDMVS